VLVGAVHDPVHSLDQTARTCRYGVGYALRMAASMVELRAGMTAGMVVAHERAWPA
jgi:hypothetical protein